MKVYPRNSLRLKFVQWWTQFKAFLSPTPTAKQRALKAWKLGTYDHTTVVLPVADYGASPSIAGGRSHSFTKAHKNQWPIKKQQPLTKNE
jgi:hypothetical protein